MPANSCKHRPEVLRQAWSQKSPRSFWHAGFFICAGTSDGLVLFLHPIVFLSELEAPLIVDYAQLQLALAARA